MNDQDLLSATQFGFQKGRICREPAWVITESIEYMARQNNKFAAFIDVKKAHPTVLRTTMMARLHTKLSEAEGGDGNRCGRAWTVIDQMYERCSSHILVDRHESGGYVVKHDSVKETFSVLSYMPFSSTKW